MQVYKAQLTTHVLTLSIRQVSHAHRQCNYQCSYSNAEQVGRLNIIECRVNTGTYTATPARGDHR